MTFKLHALFQTVALAGIIIADFTRLLQREERWLDVPLGAQMRRDPQVARADELGSAVVYRMEQRGIMAMPVLDDDGRLVGVVHLHDLMRAGAV